jgi:hypothetical protein
MYNAIKYLYPLAEPREDFILSDNGDGVVFLSYWNKELGAEPTLEELNTASLTYKAEYDSLAYARSRKQEYDKLNQWEMQFDDQRDGTTTWVDSINEIKVRFPK